MNYEHYFEFSLKREYQLLSRKAEINELIKPDRILDDFEEVVYNDEMLYQVTDVNSSKLKGKSIDGTSFIDGIYHGEYKVAVQTDIVIIGETRYKEVKRIGLEGEILIKDNDYGIGLERTGYWIHVNGEAWRHGEYSF